MKKYIISVVAILLAIVLGSCSDVNKNRTEEDVNNNIGEIDLSKIIEIDVGQYSEEKAFNHKNVITSKPEHYVDNTIQIERKLKINNIEHDLRYHETLYYPVGNKKVHEYHVDGDNEKVVLLDDTGEIKSVLYKYTSLDISPTASPNEVLSLLKLELSKIIDISIYDNINIPEQRKDPINFGMYYYLFYNAKNNYMTDYLKVAVSDDGGVFGISVNNLASNDYALNINKDKENKAIESKLKDIYDTNVSKYQYYTTSFDPCITIYEDQIYVQYFVSATYTNAQNVELSSYINIILVPLDLINN